MVHSENHRKLLRDGQIFTIERIRIECFLLPGHTRGLHLKIITGWTDDLDFVFAHRDKVCSAYRKQKPHDPDALYDAYDESDDIEEKARSVRLKKQRGMRA